MHGTILSSSPYDEMPRVKLLFHIFSTNSTPLSASTTTTFWFDNGSLVSFWLLPGQKSIFIHSFIHFPRVQYPMRRTLLWQSLHLERPLRKGLAGLFSPQFPHKSWSHPWRRPPGMESLSREPIPLTCWQSFPNFRNRFVSRNFH